MRKIKTFILAAFSLLFCTASLCSCQNSAKSFETACDSLHRRMERRYEMRGSEIALRKVLKRGDELDFYFSETLGDYPIQTKDIKWIKKNLEKEMPKHFKSYKIGKIFSRGVEIEKLTTVRPNNSGRIKADNPSSLAQSRCKASRINFVQDLNKKWYSKGLSGRNIALWQSHGYYYSNKLSKWTWQRACLFMTVEDLYTQSYVLPFLVPMIENAGGYTILPRERDLNLHEYIIDRESKNDYDYRHCGTYSESGKWTSHNEGFADKYENYKDIENPFTLGESRKSISDGKNKVSAIWQTKVNKTSEYAVYVSYKSFEQSCTKAHYTVEHLGGISEFYVNQRMGDGTWIYLGTFTFSPDKEAVIKLDNTDKDGKIISKSQIISADAVKIGGGMGNIFRSSNSKDAFAQSKVSGMPRFTEGARYWLQWAGIPSEIYTPNEGENDYKDDYTCRGNWVDYLTGGSRVNPNRKTGKNIPIDMSLAFHTDAGTALKDTTIGTLAIYTYKSEGKTEFPNGESRMISRQLCDMVQTQIVEDIRVLYDKNWRRRNIADRSYLESRTPNVPAILLELLSHQNFRDMSFGHNPEFQFNVSRSIYKGILKFLSLRYECPYVVQPLPIKSFYAELGNSQTVKLYWKEQEDKLEPTAQAQGYMLYTRINDCINNDTIAYKDAAFDNGKELEYKSDEFGRCYAELKIEKGKIYSFVIKAYNEGGISFPSETLCVGYPSDSCKANVLIVNNFASTRSPHTFEEGSIAGFDRKYDSGVSYKQNIAFIGDIYDYNRTNKWSSDENPGFGASHTDYAGIVLAGNTFDYPFIHAKSLLKQGYAISSSSVENFTNYEISTNKEILDNKSDEQTCITSDGSKVYDMIDIICGKELNPLSNRLCKKIGYFTSHGTNILISGANIASYDNDALKILGYNKQSNYATKSAIVINSKFEEFKFWNEFNPNSYSVERVNGISARDSAEVFLRYKDTYHGAGVKYKNDKYKAVSLSFPLECIKQEKDLYKIMQDISIFFDGH